MISSCLFPWMARAGRNVQELTCSVYASHGSRTIRDRSDKPSSCSHIEATGSAPGRGLRKVLHISKRQIQRVVTILSEPAFLVATIKVKKRREEAGPLSASTFASAPDCPRSTHPVPCDWRPPRGGWPRLPIDRSVPWPILDAFAESLDVRGCVLVTTPRS